MQVNSSHFQWDSLLSPKTSKSPNFEKILEIAHKNELTDLVVPYLHTPNRSNLEAYKKTADQLNKGAIQAKEAEFDYHTTIMRLSFSPYLVEKPALMCLREIFPRICFLN